MEIENSLFGLPAEKLEVVLHPDGRIEWQSAKRSGDKTRYVPLSLWEAGNEQDRRDRRVEAGTGEDVASEDRGSAEKAEVLVGEQRLTVKDVEWYVGQSEHYLQKSETVDRDYEDRYIHKARVYATLANALALSNLRRQKDRS